uniref:Uncharacterized protein n=4 Tax=Amphidinium carterae TaxID=2961 RepID=I2CSX9_AMPCA|nr:hypothetical protein [Amphidinium carterae]AFJ70054.1 hypothetical protein [Amphidinium carterae]AFJ70056.1 hypothetical protein [Amphidinium carterae]AFJ70058.1 hypothetical protein [Amphidinium carterae]AFJ70060.1 hypothetical protein [Amphidinium carterae]
MLLNLLYLNKYFGAKGSRKVAAYLSLGDVPPILFLEKVILSTRISASLLNYSWKQRRRGSNLTLSNMASPVFTKTKSLNKLSLSILNRFN